MFGIDDRVTITAGDKRSLSSNIRDPTKTASQTTLLRTDSRPLLDQTGYSRRRKGQELIIFRQPRDNIGIRRKACGITA